MNIPYDHLTSLSTTNVMHNELEGSQMNWRSLSRNMNAICRRQRCEMVIWNIYSLFVMYFRFLISWASVRNRVQTQTRTHLPFGVLTLTIIIDQNFVILILLLASLSSPLLFLQHQLPPSFDYIAMIRIRIFRIPCRRRLQDLRCPDSLRLQVLNVLQHKLLWVDHPPQKLSQCWSSSPASSKHPWLLKRNPTSFPSMSPL